HDGERWAGKLEFRQSFARFTVESVRLEGDRIEVVFQGGSTPDKLELSAWIRDDRLIGEIRWGGVSGAAGGGRRRPELKRAAVDHSLPASDIEKSGADAAALHTLLEHARAERTSALVVVKDGKLGLEMYREGYDGGPLIAMSASKSVV